jgi:hypothetical protein
MKSTVSDLRNTKPILAQRAGKKPDASLARLRATGLLPSHRATLRSTSTAAWTVVERELI